MNEPYLTITLPITETAGLTLLASIGVAGLTGLVWLILDGMNRQGARDEDPLARAVRALGLVLLPVWFWLLGAAIVSLWRMFGGTAPDTPATGLGTGALIVALLSAPFVIWRTHIAQRSLGFQKEGHITDRISKAVEQLGAEKTVRHHRVNAKGKKVYRKGADGTPDFSEPVFDEETRPNIEVRIGAILSLERIAQDSVSYDKGRDHVRVMEILCAYVRENAKAENLDPTPDLSTRKRPRIDIQTAIDVIGRRSDRQVALEASERFRLDLHDTDLDGCHLRNGKFAGAILWRSRMEAADLTNCDLTGTQMQYSLLNFARFQGATLRGTNLDHTIFSEPPGGSFPYFVFAKVHGVTVVGADLTAVNHLGENASKILGSWDTKLSTPLQLKKEEFTDLKRDLDRLPPGADAAEVDSLKAQIDQSPFANWIEYPISDFELGHYRGEFHARLGITGWPFED